jgi:OmpA-OmpF porin, OOP family
MGIAKAFAQRHRPRQGRRAGLRASTCPADAEGSLIWDELERKLCVSNVGGARGALTAFTSSRHEALMRDLHANNDPSPTRVPALLAAAVALLLARPSSAQSSGATGSLERFHPAPAGDAMFGVASPSAGGHLVPRAAVIVDYASKPLSIQDGSQRYAIVSNQLFLHLDVSLSLFDRLLISVDMPFALAQGGDSPTVAGVPFASPTTAQAGDLRLGARARLFGGYWDPFQVGVGGYVYVPTAPAASYAGDGAVRGEPQLVIGGRFQHFVYSASLGTMLRASTHPSSFDAGVGAAVILGDNLLQLGPELTVSTPFSKDVLAKTNETTITVASQTAAELLLGAKVRLLRSLVIGAGAGPGLTQGWGTPVFFAVGSVGYEPLPPRAGAEDTDDDGIVDPADACPTERGVRSEDPKKNGCPPDTDGDGILDVEDACPKVPGVASEDPKKNGCPPDTDGDGILDTEDACPKDPGVKSEDPKKNGCPLDADGDGIPDAKDACPKEPGAADPDPTKNGCPHVTVTKGEIVINRQVQFHFGQSNLAQTVDPVSDDLLAEVRDAMVKHPEIELIEVQGHTDNVGPEEYNQTLSEARAEAVRAWLVTRGIPKERLVAKGYGSKTPVASNDSDQGRQENRRVQFIIVQKKTGDGDRHR